MKNVYTSKVKSWVLEVFILLFDISITWSNKRRLAYIEL